MTTLGPGILVLITAFALGACAGPPPKGLVPPAASEATVSEDQAGAPFQIPPGLRLVALRVTVDNPPPELLDDQGTGVLTLRRKGTREPLRLIFANGALGIHALQPGNYRVTNIAGYDCGELSLPIAARETPLALGNITLDTSTQEATLAGAIPTLDDLTRIAGLVDADAATIEADPIERGHGISCTRRTRAVSRPDVDPTIYKPTPAEIAGGVLFLAILGGATAGAAAAGGTVFFFSGGAGGSLFLGF